MAWFHHSIQRDRDRSLYNHLAAPTVHVKVTCFLDAHSQTTFWVDSDGDFIASSIDVPVVVFPPGVFNEAILRKTDGRTAGKALEDWRITQFMRVPRHSGGIAQ